MGRSPFAIAVSWSSPFPIKRIHAIDHIGAGRNTARNGNLALGSQRCQTEALVIQLLSHRALKRQLSLQSR